MSENSINITTPNSDEIDPLTMMKHDTERVGFRIGKTINMGNFESARVDCWIEKTYQTQETQEKTQQEQEKALNEAKKFCNDNLRQFVTIIERKRDNK